jgi:hypothetical protein
MQRSTSDIVGAVATDVLRVVWLLHYFDRLFLLLVFVECDIIYRSVSITHHFTVAYLKQDVP